MKVEQLLEMIAVASYCVGSPARVAHVLEHVHLGAQPHDTDAYFGFSDGLGRNVSGAMRRGGWRRMSGGTGMLLRWVQRAKGHLDFSEHIAWVT